MREAIKRQSRGNQEAIQEEQRAVVLKMKHEDGEMEHECWGALRR